MKPPSCLILALAGALLSACSTPMETVTVTRTGATGQPETVTTKRPIADPWDTALSQAMVNMMQGARL